MNKQTIAMKFGGSSVADAKAIKRVLSIVSDRLTRKPVVILSACKGDTDLLAECSRLAARNKTEELNNKLRLLESKHITICEQAILDEQILKRALNKIYELHKSLKEYLKGLSVLEENTPQSLDYVYSFGEIISTNIFYFVCLDNNIKAGWIDAREFVKTDSNFNSAKPNLKEIKKITLPIFLALFKEYDLVITQGFIGSDGHDNTTTLGRGGSDYSAAIIGAAIGASEIQIWSDVSGVLTADPRILPSAKTVEYLTPGEVRELGYFGAKVLHVDTIVPATIAGIPVRALNTFEPNNPGTLITEDKVILAGNGSKSLVLKNDIVLVQIKVNFENENIVLESLIRLKKLGYKIVKMFTEPDFLFLMIEDDKNLQEALGVTFSEFNVKLEKYSIVNAVGKIADLKIIDNINRLCLKYSAKKILFGDSLSQIFLLSPQDSALFLEELHREIFEFELNL